MTLPSAPQGSTSAAAPRFRLLAEMLTWADFVKLSHTVFVMPFGLAAMAVAARANRGWPGWKDFLLIVLAMIAARTCAMAFNRIADRNFDKANPRTQNRHLPTGQISLASAVALCLVSAGLLVGASYFLNPLCFYLSPVAIFMVCFYSLTKRFTAYTHVFLGLALALAPLGAWLAVRGSFTFVPINDGALIPLVLSVAVLFWLVGFDIIYALQDYEFDRKHGLHSLVVAWGPVNALKAAFLAHLVTWGLLMVFGLLCRFRVAYFVGLLIILVCLLLEHWIARKRSLKWINTAFFKLNALVSLIFFVVTLVEVVFPGFRMLR